LTALPALIETALERWSLRLTSLFEAPTMIGFVAAVERADGAPAVLKLNAPDRESAHEAEVLAHWCGEGAVRLLASAHEHRAMLLERCMPGTPLWAVENDDEATRIAASVMRQIWRAPAADHPFAFLADEGHRWIDELPRTYERLGRTFERGLLDLAVGACRELIADPIEPVVVHQDLHGGNILRAEREPWLVIDPKPLVGERAFDVVSLVRDRRDTLTAEIVRRRLDILREELSLDRERMRLWSLVHALAWGEDDGDDGYDPGMLHAARLLAQAT